MGQKEKLSHNTLQLSSGSGMPLRIALNWGGTPLFPGISESSHWLGGGTIDKLRRSSTLLEWGRVPIRDSLSHQQPIYQSLGSRWSIEMSIALSVSSFLYPRRCSRLFTFITLFNPHYNSMRQPILLYLFSDKEIEVQRSNLIKIKHLTLGSECMCKSVCARVCVSPIYLYRSFKKSE